MGTLDAATKIAHAELNLQRKLEWISRYDTRIVFVAGTAIAMLGVLASASGNIDCWTIDEYISFGLTLIMLVATMICIYLSQKPAVISPNESLLFFGTVGKMTISDFVTRFKGATEEEYLEDLLHQIHVNAQILNKKFANMKLALMFIALAVTPWAISIYLSKLYLH